MTTTRDFITAVKMMRTAQTVYKKTHCSRAKIYAEKLEKEVDEALCRALQEKKISLTRDEQIREAGIRG